ncbi:MAG: hypothetical protein ACJ75G_05570 [Gaiellaceae bacterium]
MKSIAAALLAAALLVATVFLLLGAGNSSPGSGLRGTVLLDPGYPVCQAGTSCTRPAADAQLRFWRNGRVVAHTRTDGKGRFRIALSPRRYRVTSATMGLLTPVRVTVPTGRYRSVTFKLDIGIR